MASPSSLMQQGRVLSDMNSICPQPCLLHRPCRERARVHKHNGRRPPRQAPAICASSAAPFGPGGGSELVDSNLSVLRKRIHRLRSLEEMDRAPEEWMEWEKSCYPSYRADVAYFMAGLQSQLLEIRPSVSLFILSVILSAMPVASLLILRFLLQQWVSH